MTSFIIERKKHYCKLCDKPIEIIVLADSPLEEWVCPEHGNIEESYTKSVL